MWVSRIHNFGAKIQIVDNFGWFSNNVKRQKICANNSVLTSTQEERNEDLIKLIFDYARKNIIHMKVFFKRPYYTEIRRDLQMTAISFIGTIGGLASLCLGLSWISIVEILYHCFCSFARIAGKRFWNINSLVFVFFITSPSV